MGDGACGVNGFATDINAGSKIILIFAQYSEFIYCER